MDSDDKIYQIYDDIREAMTNYYKDRSEGKEEFAALRDLKMNMSKACGVLGYRDVEAERFYSEDDNHDVVELFPTGKKEIL